MSVRPYRGIVRRRSRQIHGGKVPVGGDAPITVQTMTNTRTTAIEGTIAQVRAMEIAGADIVRISCPAEDYPGAEADHPGSHRSTRRRHPLPLPPRHRGGGGGGRLPAHQPPFGRSSCRERVCQFSLISCFAGTSTKKITI